VTVTTTVPGASPPTETVRKAVHADLLAVFQIEQASFPQPWPYSAFEQFLDSPGFLVAETGTANSGHDHVDKSGIVGYVVADAIPNHGTPLGHIKDLAVHPEFRGEGLGKRLMRRALVVLESQGVGSVKLEVRYGNDRARSLYRKLGFEHCRTIPNYYDNGEDALVLLR
jgi:ribosomal-protein-alanine N-acetyltransferase